MIYNVSYYIEYIHPNETVYNYQWSESVGVIELKFTLIMYISSFWLPDVRRELDHL